MRTKLPGRDPVAAAARWTVSKWRAQLLIYLSAYWAYSATRWIAAGEVHKATVHARGIVHLEQTLHLSVERSVQRALDTGAPIWLLNHLYLVAQFAASVPGRAGRATARRSPAPPASRRRPAGTRPA